MFIAYFTLPVCECFKFSLLMEYLTLKHPKLARGMFFTKSYLQMFMTRYLFLEINESKNTRVPDAYYKSNDHADVVKSTERQKTSFPKELVENALNPYRTK